MLGGMAPTMVIASGPEVRDSEWLLAGRMTLHEYH
jgi:hypothetical protein